MINWEKISYKIMEFIDLNDELWPSYNKVSEASARIENIDRTLLSINMFLEGADELWVYEGEEKATVLFKIFHECWHAYQKSQGIDIRYSKEDRDKFVLKKHNMMLYNYQFESEATGYASAFVYYVSKFAKLLNKDCFEKEIEDCYTNVDTFPKEEFDSKNDFITINNQIKSYYEKGKSYIENQMVNSLSDEMKNILASCKIDYKYIIYLASKKGLIIHNIIMELLK